MNGPYTIASKKKLVVKIILWKMRHCKTVVNIITYHHVVWQ
jgi:hypothetical protein